MTPSQILDSLTFASYAHNRRLGVTPAGFKRMGFPDVDAHESRFQLERITAMRDEVEKWNRERINETCGLQLKRCPVCRGPAHPGAYCKPLEAHDNGPTHRHISEHP